MQKPSSVGHPTAARFGFARMMKTSVFAMEYKGFYYSILITTICVALHHSHAIAVSTDGPFRLLGTLHEHDSPPE